MSLQNILSEILSGISCWGQKKERLKQALQDLVSQKQSLPTGPGNSFHSKTIWETGDRGTDHLGRITYNILKTCSNSATVLSSIPLLSASFSPLFSLPPIPFSLTPLLKSPPPHSTDQTMLFVLGYFLLPQWSYVHRLRTLTLHQFSIYTQPSFLKNSFNYFKCRYYNEPNSPSSGEERVFLKLHKHLPQRPRQVRVGERRKEKQQHPLPPLQEVNQDLQLDGWAGVHSCKAWAEIPLSPQRLTLSFSQF